MTKNTALLGASALAVAALLAGCATSATDDTAASTSAPEGIHAPLTVTYDGGIYVLDGETLEVGADVPLDGFLRVNGVGDETHVAVSTESGFQLLDAAAGQLTDVTYPGSKPGHVVLHADKTVFFLDGTGEAFTIDSHDVAEGPDAAARYTSADPHHGVAVELEDGTFLVTVGTEEGRDGAIALDADGTEIASSNDCVGIHGEAVAAGEVAAFGCEDGVLLYKDGAFVKVDAPADYARSGNLRGSHESPVLLGDYKTDAEAELERPNQFVLVDSETATMSVVDLPEGVSYTFRSLARGAHGEAYILGTDGAVYVIDPATGEISDSWDVIGEWSEPLDWQEARPAIFVRGHDVYVTDPATNSVHRLDGHTGEVLASVELDAAPNEIAGVSVEDEHED